MRREPIPLDLTAGLLVEDVDDFRLPAGLDVWVDPEEVPKDPRTVNPDMVVDVVLMCVAQLKACLTLMKIGLDVDLLYSMFRYR